MSDFQVRPATLKDARTVAEIHVAAWQAAYKSVLGEEQLAIVTVERRQAYWREAIDLCEPQLLVATASLGAEAAAGRAIVGFAAFDRSRDKGTPQATGEIWALYTDPARWSAGVGQALWLGVRDGLQEEGCTEATLWLPLHNERALHFFERLGFEREPSSLRQSDVAGVKVPEIRLRRATG